MSIHTYSSRDFTRDVGTAKRAAAEGPVFITDRGRPAFALLKIEDYYHLAGQQAGSRVGLRVGQALSSTHRACNLSSVPQSWAEARNRCTFSTPM
jgi:PHD/YefM family antitoxin component YafN of YafNO toxin-antitoxin module